MDLLFRIWVLDVCLGMRRAPEGLVKGNSGDQVLRSRISSLPMSIRYIASLLDWDVLNLGSDSLNDNNTGMRIQNLEYRTAGPDPKPLLT
jgi:hypothetical protein